MCCGQQPNAMRIRAHNKVPTYYTKPPRSLVVGVSPARDLNWSKSLPRAFWEFRSSQHRDATHSVDRQWETRVGFELGSKTKESLKSSDLIGQGLFLSDPRSYTKRLFTPWTMMSFQGPLKFVIGCWTRPGTISVYIKKKMSVRSWGSRSLKDIFRGPTLSTNMVQPVFWTFFFTSTHSLLVDGHSTWSTFGLHLVRGPKTL
jgi:hypothetical protein